MGFNYSKTSKERLNTCHPDLIKIMNFVIRYSSVDIGIAEGHRSVKRQFRLFQQGKSKIDGYSRLGKHNYRPSMAVDIYAFFNNKAQWDAETITYIMGMIHLAAEVLFEQGEISHKVRWGGNWDMDGVVLLDQSFDDRPHVELIKP